MLQRTKTSHKIALCFVLLAAAGTLLFLRNPAQAQQSPPVPHLTFKAADPKEKGDGTLGPAAREAIAHGPLPMSKADVDAKAAANKASAEALKALKKAPAPRTRLEQGLDDHSDAAPPESKPMTAVPPFPVIVGGINFQGLASQGFSPSDSTGAIGPFNFIQLVNVQAGLCNRSSGDCASGSLTSGSLQGLAGTAATTIVVDPQIIWDSTSRRFYYTMIEIFSANDHRLAFGFSKSMGVTDLSNAWCHYEIGFGTTLPDFPKLGDSQDFVIIGVNAFFPTGLPSPDDMRFAGSDLIAISKPPAGVTCPPASSFKLGAAFNLVDTAGKQVFTPVPANQIDLLPAGLAQAGFVVARNGTVPKGGSNKLWFFKVTKDSSGTPVFGKARGLTVNTYKIPPAAAQLGATQTLDTLSAQMTQAVMAFNPRTKRNEFWTQHTIMSPKNPALSALRYYEIDPVPSSPKLLKTNFISAPFAFVFNGAISPDRVLFGDTAAFGNSFVLEFNRSGLNDPIQIFAASSVNGAALGFIGLTLAAPGTVPYTDSSCPKDGDTCRWGDYSGASPDPAPDTLGISDSGAVWGTNQTSTLPPPESPANFWSTQFFALKP
jgi:hypothetical protein